MPDDMPKQLEQAALGVLQMFAAVCGDPDNPQTAQQADQSLRDLEDLLAAAALAGPAEAAGAGAGEK
jgi:hypothetical protein